MRTGRPHAFPIQTKVPALWPSGTLVGEVVSSPDHTVAMAVSRGRLLIQARAGASIGIAEVELPYGGSLALSEGDFRNAELDEIALRGGSIDLHPFRLDLGGALGAFRLEDAWIGLYGPELRVNWRFHPFRVGVQARLGFSGVSSGSGRLSRSGSGYPCWSASGSGCTPREADSRCRAPR
jgi:hypothetical protein